MHGQFIDRVLDISVAHREGTHSANCAEDCSWRRRPCDQQRQFSQFRGSNPAPDSVRPLSGEHSHCATVFVEIPQVQFLDKVEICPLLRRQVQFLVF